MKKFLLAFALLLSSLGSLKATHMMGGQITVQHISGMDYRVKYTAYRDTVGIPIANYAILTFIDSSSMNSFTASIPYDTLVVSLIPGVEEYVYDTVLTFPNTGSWYVSYEECCRNFAILNMSQPGSETHHFYSRVLIDSLNSTPVFLNPPIVVAQENVPFYYNPLPFDADGDSIAWSLDVPLSMNGLPVLGYSLPPSDSLVPFNMDPLTGEITFLPNTLGNFQVSVRVREYRAGVQIGEISRDMQLIVVGSGNRPALVTVNANQAPYNAKSYTIAPGAGFSMAVTVYDQDGQQVQVQGAGEPFLLNTNPATVSISNSSSGSTATVQWTPSSAQARTAPYLLGLRITESFGMNVFQSDVTFTLRVGNATTGIQAVEESVPVSIHPNPNSGSFALSFFSDRSDEIELSLLTLDGKRVATFTRDEVTAGLNVVRFDRTDLAPGLYMAIVRQGGSVIGTQRMLVQ